MPVKNTTCWKKLISYFFLWVFIFAPIYSIPQKAHAQDGDDAANIAAWGVNILQLVEDGVTSVATTLSSSMLTSMNLKEWSLDGVAFFLAKRVLTEMARSTVSWINSGFQGSPMFMTDPQGFMLNIADEAAGQVLYGSDLAFLCSPVNVRIALNLVYTNSRNRKPVQCTLSSAVGNVQNFANDFMSGGWTSWISLSLTPTNSTVGSGIHGAALLSASISSSQGRASTQASWGRGFLSREECTGGAQQGPTESGAPMETTPKKCRTITPGSTISDALTFNIQGSERSLIEADEINEIVGALIGQALRQGLTAARGLFTSNTNTYSSSRFDGSSGNSATCNSLTYIQQLNTEGCNPGYSSNDTTTSYSGAGSISVAINDEKTYQAIQRRVVSAADAIIARAKGEASVSENDAREGEEVIVCTINDGVIKKAQDEKDAALSAIAASEKMITDLTALQKKVDEGAEEEKLAAYTTFGSITSSGALHTSITNVRTKSEVDDKVVAIEALNQDIRECPRRSRSNNSSSDGGGGGSGGD